MAAILAAVCVAGAMGAPRAAGTALGPENQQRLDATVRYLQDVQNRDGGFGGARGAQSDPVFSAWVALALAAAGINPQDQALPGGEDVFTYTAEHASELSVTTDYERALLVVDAAGTSPHSFGGVDLVRAILDRKLPDGSFSHAAGSQSGINDTVFAVLSLSPLTDSAATAAVQAAANWLEREQLDDGSWPSNCPRTLPGCAAKGEVDMTGAAIEALSAAGRPSNEDQHKALRFLHEVQGADGGFPETAGEAESNVASTAWAAQAIWSVGDSPETWAVNAANPLSYMASLQQADGSIHFKASEASIPVWMTAYVAPAFARQPYPVHAVPRATPPTPSAPAITTAAPAAEAAQSGQGGRQGGSGGGVIAGGGGRGAPLFSRPQPQSSGRTPGGRRQLERRSRAVSARHIDEATVQASASPEPEATRSKIAGSASQGKSAQGSTPAPSAQSGAGDQAGGDSVNGLLVSASTGARARQATTDGAPGLHGASPGGSQSAWLAIVIAAVLALMFVGGSQLERRRPQEVL